MAIDSAEENKSGKQPRVLVVDDNSAMRRAMELILRAEFDVTPLESGNRAVEHIRQDNDFDVVSLDLNMPGMSGIETLQVIKELSPTTEVLLVTAFQDLESAKQALKLGAYDYIEKPINKDDYRESIRKGVRRRQKTLESEHAVERLDIVKAQLVHSEKLSAIGQLLAGVVHELNNPLSGIVGYSELLLMSQASPEKSHKYIENIRQCAQLCQNIVQKLLAFSRKQEVKRVHVQIGDILSSTLELVQHEIKKSRVQVVKQLAENIPRTSADYYQIQQVFLNIITNAVQAMQEQDRPGTLTVKSEFDDRFIRINLLDTGPGIPQENLQDIFEPFFTTKPEGKGTGLGLSVCYEIIQEHGGDLYVSSEPGSGSCFVVELPITAKTEVVRPAAPSSKGDQAATGKKILVIDEKETGHDLLENIITTLKHQVDVAQEADAAREKLRSTDYDIIISNLAMPNFGGQQLCEYLEQVNPELVSKIIFITGGVISEEIGRFLKQKRTPYINKPFGIDDIQKAIQKIGEASAAG